MMTNHLLEDKYRVQRQLAEEAGYDARKYHENIHKEALELQQREGVKLRYIEREPRGVSGDKGRGCKAE